MVFLAYSLFLWSMSVFAEIAKAIPDLTTRPIFTLLGIFAFGIVVVKSPQLLSSFLGGNTSLSDGNGNIMGLKVATNAFMTGGAIAYKGAKLSLKSPKTLYQKSASGIGALRGIDLTRKEHGAKNIFKSGLNTAFTKDFQKTKSTATDQIKN